MSLPKIASPKFAITLPSNDREIRFRPFVVKEEKVLLIAAESKDTKIMMQSMIDVASACVEDPNFDISKLPHFDVEFLFLNLRAKSVGEKTKLEYRHTNGINYAGIKCENVTPLEIDIESVKVSGGNSSMRVKITDKYSIEMRYPTLGDISAINHNDKVDLDLIARCIVCVYDNDEVFEPDDLEDAKKFIESLSAQQFKNITEFFENMPKLKHTMKYKCVGCGQEDEIVLEGIADFF